MPETSKPKGSRTIVLSPSIMNLISYRSYQQFQYLIIEMSLHAHISELCKIILTFQNDITPLKEQLFNWQIVTRQLLWNHMIGEPNPQASGEMIAAFFSKHGLNLSKKDIELIIWQFSSNKDNALNINDLWQIFKPLSVKLVQQINTAREKKAVVAKFHEASYKISDLLGEIMGRTVTFLRKTQEVKFNIVKSQAEDVVIEPCDAPHLQIYLNKVNPDFILKQVDIIFRHMMRNQQICLKTFQQYFIPLGYKGGSLNPNFVRQNELVQQAKGIQLMKYHAENVYHITQQRAQKPLYLHPSVSSKQRTSSSKKILNKGTNFIKIVKK